MSPWPDPSCPECGGLLPSEGYRVRPVPRLGGQRRQVCDPCAGRIDEQQVLWGSEVDRAVRNRRQAADVDHLGSAGIVEELRGRQRARGAVRDNSSEAA